MQAWTLALVLVVTLPLGALLFWNAREAARQHDGETDRRPARPVAHFAPGDPSRRGRPFGARERARPRAARERAERVVDVAIEPGLRAVADVGLARIVLANLIGNAWKFTGKAARASVCFEAADVDGRPGFVVRDNGAGFDLAYADKLFGPFQRLHSERDFPGTGIGLAIVQRIVHRHGGEIRVRAAPGEGAAFSFTL